ncbi:hypothetical protein DCE79_11070 [Lysinibacillus sp. 2017]|uniref:hypothetical protein n=1 Tax=unclassified Lysinibacillus TaxID=2636778 RepID=UPI000D52A46A|nr:MULTISPECIES: hypothetical protein [unclassified Lysinibacillus]AWE07893.1 hypothetical protein DCE79_11070 [Lysinibacillus sp. 2017]TGN33159.1 hypothetical protein E4L99_15065 [Lysinibacillus sp. S2017]
MAAELWRQSENSFTLYLDTKHVREVSNIKRSRDWDVTATYQKGGQVVGLQWRVPESDYRAAKRIEKRVNANVHEIEESPHLSAESVG